MSDIDKASVSYEFGIVEDLRADPDFAAAYLRAALEDEENPRGAGDGIAPHGQCMRR